MLNSEHSNLYEHEHIKHACIHTVDHDRVIGNLSCIEVSIVFLFSTLHATLYHCCSIYLGLLHLFNILYSTYKYTVFCTKFHVCVLACLVQS